MHGIENRVCRICGTEKAATEFYKRKDNAGKFRTECKECTGHAVRFNQTGWTKEAYQEKFVEQKGLCAICNSTLNSSRYTKLCGDHDHYTGKLRGLLCGNCNTALGLMKDSPQRFFAAANYIQQHTQDNEIVSSCGQPQAAMMMAGVH